MASEELEEKMKGLKEKELDMMENLNIIELESKGLLKEDRNKNTLIERLDEQIQ